MDKKKLMSTAIAGVVALGVVMAQNAFAQAAGGEAKSEQGKCTNSCKGKGDCKTATNNTCAGKNDCKGKGMLKNGCSSKTECEKKGHTWETAMR
jgi:hypothetical protein